LVQRSVLLIAFNFANNAQRTRFLCMCLGAALATEVLQWMWCTLQAQAKEQQKQTQA